MTNIAFLKCHDPNCGESFYRDQAESVVKARIRAKRNGWTSQQWAASVMWYCPKHSPEYGRAIQSDKGDSSPRFIAQWERLIDASVMFFHPYVAEYHFDPTSNARGDMVFVRDKLAVEFNGGRYAVAGGAHNTDEALARDNRYAILGYRLLRFTPQQVEDDPIGCIKTILQALGYNDDKAMQVAFKVQLY